MKAPLQQNHLNPRKLFTYTLYVLIPLALLHYYHLLKPYPAAPARSTSSPQIHTSHIHSHDDDDGFVQPPVKGNLNLQQLNTNLSIETNTSSLFISISVEFKVQNQMLPQCDYSSGTWIRDERGPLYNGTSCNTIKENQNCMAHGRPDTGYLYWRWRPTKCSLPRFDPLSFLQIIRNRHLAFIGDSLARNQAESLMCLLASGSHPELVYQDSTENHYRRWIFGSYNATVSIYWSPFLVKRIEKSEKEGIRHNRVFLDSFDERWINEFESMDVIVFSLGHWFLIPGIYYENEQIIGCHVCPEFNHTEIGFFDVFRKAVRRTLEEAHFEGEWDKVGSCARKEPYKEGEVKMEYMAGEMRRTVVDALESLRGNGDGSSVNGLQFEAVDVTC
ncbi:protein ALTERED XYLOGLUCAN 4-like isoform X1 [Carex littledalei]|uniref:Protein ALTERED XYLOGLUCAN 4-like isoform X1 n=1 Tax=Carex littledalei TaxID=544730 RepID=A0A833VJI2_9POAL|nr:protein ALTERED XYLOGLUCAN 4-like isoform X1 [Carex littledalei]